VVFALWRREPSTSGRLVVLPEVLRDDVQAIVALDRRYEAGELDADAYEAERRAAKSRIRDRLQRKADE
jgi:hypothetical protein